LSFAGSNESSLKFYAAEYMAAIKSSDYRSAAELLHYPESMVGIEKEKEVQAMIQSIKVLVNELGTIQKAELGIPGAFLSVFIMTGSLDYWAGKYSGVTLTYRVIFSEKGEGYLFFRFPRVQGRFVLRAVEYGLPASNLSTVPTLQRIMRELEAIE